ncbi:hypothetical protein C5167_034895 [Papaver somniferum]|uniref:Kinesin motor domain-containing protein n=1 Tax=Papaver somniferum TaxID=3469 RepID=A0A4Y7KFY0_PAPSO|nr:hypothetical protein C5167_034895 [Papaver somniferum]
MGIGTVAVNVRPLSDEEVLKGCKNCVAFIPGEPQVKIGTHSFTFDHVYGNKASSPISIYGDCVAPLVDALFDGYNATVLAHGQTGSGKTYTMGTNYTGDGSTGGIIPQVMNSIFSKIEEKKEAKEFLIRVSFIEIFREEVIDLLDPNSGKGKRTVAKVAAKKPIPIRELEEGVFTVPDAAAVEVRTKQQMASFLSQGSLKRATGSTNMNSQSSRSHAIFTISMEQRRSTRIPGDGILSAKLQFVDLAGIPINKEILALEQMISALVVNKKRKEGGHDSLDGNSKTVMIACVCPADSYITETLNTLTCACLARNIQNKAIVGTVNQSHELECLRKALTLEKNRSMDKSAELESLKKALTLSEEHIARERKCSMDKSAEIEQLKLKISVAEGEIRELHQNSLANCIPVRIAQAFAINSVMYPKETNIARIKAPCSSRLVAPAHQVSDKALQKENRLLKDELLHMKSNASPAGSKGAYSTSWNAHRSLEPPTTLPHVDDDSDDAMGMDETVERHENTARKKAKTRKRKRPLYNVWKPDEFKLLEIRVPQMKTGKIPWGKILSMGGFLKDRNPRQLKSKWERETERKRQRTEQSNPC